MLNNILHFTLIPQHRKYKKYFPPIVNLSNQITFTFSEASDSEYGGQNIPSALVTVHRPPCFIFK